MLDIDLELQGQVEKELDQGDQPQAIETLIQGSFEKVIESQQLYDTESKYNMYNEVEYFEDDFIKIKAQDQIKYDKLDSIIKFRNDAEYSYFNDLEQPMRRMKVKESNIPLQVLYNPQVEKIKREDRFREEQNIRPLVFSYKFNDEKTNITGVKVEVMGDEVEMKEVQLKQQMNQEKIFNQFLKATPKIGSLYFDGDNNTASPKRSNLPQSFIHNQVTLNRRGTLIIKQNRFSINLGQQNHSKLLRNQKVKKKVKSQINNFEEATKLIQEEEDEEYSGDENYEEMKPMKKQQENRRESINSIISSDITPASSEQSRMQASKFKQNIQRFKNQLSVQTRQLKLDSFRVKISPKTKQTVANLNIFSPSHNNEPILKQNTQAFHSLSIIRSKPNTSIIDHSKLSRTANNSPHFKFLQSSPMRYKSQMDHNLLKTSIKTALKTVSLLEPINKSKLIFSKWYLNPDQLSQQCKKTFNNPEQITQMENKIMENKINKRSVKQMVDEIKENVIKIRNKNKI
ncbi:UNKNOWN [Stylonychia lemnae]|uniref:Uncharacterized protein n=1 Tax=Stylonychia lemnae TaxID=5949 RepID=A0A077ZUG5_STYLE|nr:UNKNOWN [Stylonychia lemnae]|eukprot:CDW73204.1 UNKNOWN [Stylonychia lemnae]